MAPQGIRTLVAVNDTKLVAALQAEGAVWNETWAFYPGKHHVDLLTHCVPTLAYNALTAVSVQPQTTSH